MKNVNYWYWEHKPPLTQKDIAEKVGCSTPNICNFMAKNNISSVKNRFLFGIIQTRILEFLELNGSSFLPEIKRSLVSSTTPSLIGSIKTLRVRKFIDRKKKINLNAKLKVNETQFEYSLTRQGREALNRVKSGEHRTKKAPSMNQATKQKFIIGKNQVAMLKVLKTGPLFLTEIFPLVNHLNNNIGRIRDGLLRLFKKGLVLRNKERDLNIRQRLHYKFSISEKGVEVLKNL